MRKYKNTIIFGSMFLLFCIAMATSGVNLRNPLKEASKETFGNNYKDSVDIFAMYNGIIQSSVIYLEINNVSSSVSKDKVNELILRFAAKLKHKTYSRVKFVYKNTTKFSLSGKVFKYIGEKYGKIPNSDLLNLINTSAFDYATENKISEDYLTLWYK